MARRPCGVTSDPIGAESARAGDLLDEAGSGERLVGPVFGEGFEGAGRGFHGDEFFQLGHPDALGLEVRLEIARSHGGDMHADTAFLLGETATMDFRSANGLGPGDAALSRHKMEGRD